MIEGSARVHKPLELLGIMQGSGQVGVGLLEPDFHKMCAALSGPQDKREKDEWREGPSGSGGGGQGGRAGRQRGEGTDGREDHTPRRAGGGGETGGGT